VRLGVFGKLKKEKAKDFNGIRTRDLPASSIATQPITLPHAPS
jgi:hypothetical protein